MKADWLVGGVPPIVMSISQGLTGLRSGSRFCRTLSASIRVLVPGMARQDRAQGSGFLSSEANNQG
jgi:hypothetical protein